MAAARRLDKTVAAATGNLSGTLRTCCMPNTFSKGG
jgi:hypothetical protein